MMGGCIPLSPLRAEPAPRLGASRIDRGRIKLVAAFSGCTATLELGSPREAAQYIWAHRSQADTWEITPNEVESEIMAHIRQLRGDA